MKKWFKYFLYISLLFLLIYLIKKDGIETPNIYKPVNLVLSFLLLFAGFILMGFNWFKTLNLKQKKQNHYISIKDSIISNGLSIFGKYIPGKFWLIAGRAEYITLKYDNTSRTNITSLSIYNQILIILSGLLVGLFGLLILNIQQKLLFPLLAGIAMVFLITFFFNDFNKYIQKLFYFFSKKELQFPNVKKIEVLKVFPFFIIDWILRGLAFYLFTNSLIPESISLFTFSFLPIAGVIGIISIFAPGGIGIREGLLVLLFSSIGLETAQGTTIAVTSRLWFLIGEIFIFLLALIINKTSKKPSRSPTSNN